MGAYKTYEVISDRYKEQQPYSIFKWEDKFDQIVQGDNEDKLLQLLQAPAYDKPKALSPGMFASLVTWNATKCADLLLGRIAELGIDPNFNEPDTACKRPVLHMAAAVARLRLVELLIRYNAQTDLRIDFEGDKYHNMLPLNVALLRARLNLSFMGWTPEQPILNLISMLCCPSSRQRLEVCKLLALKTDKVEEEIYVYAMEGKVVELCVLLMVAREKVTASPFFRKLPATLSENQSDISLDSSMTLRDFVTAELAFLTAEEAKIANGIGSRKLAMECKGKQDMLWGTLLLLEVFGIVGDEIVKYIQLGNTHVQGIPITDVISWNSDVIGKQVATDVAQIFQKLKVKPKDTYLRDKKQDTEELNGIIPEEWESQLTGRKEKKRLKKCSLEYLINLPYTPLVHNVRIAPPYARGIMHVDMHTAQVNRLPLKDELDEALKLVRDHEYLKDWTPKKSIYKLLYVLCLPDVRQLLESVQLVVDNTEELVSIICCYAVEERLVNLAAVLMMYREKLKATFLCPSDDGPKSGESTVIHQCIMREIQKEIDEVIKHMGTSFSRKLVRTDRMANMLSALQLLEVFRKAGDTIDQYFWLERYRSRTKEGVAEDVAWLLKKAGFSLKRKDIVLDDMNCFSNNAGPEQSEPGECLQRGTGRLKLRTVSALGNTAPTGTRSRGTKSCGAEIGVTKMDKTTNACSGNHSYHTFPFQISNAAAGLHFSCTTKNACSGNGSYHTLHSPKATAGLPFSLSRRTEASQRTKSMEPCILNVSSSRKRSSIALAVSRPHGFRPILGAKHFL